MLVDYCTTAKIKQRLNITIADYDTELEAIRDDMEAEIDTHLKNYTTVPLTATNDQISDICAEMCEIEWKKLQASNPEAAEALRIRKEQVLEKLDRYVAETYVKDEIPFIVGEADS